MMSFGGFCGFIHLASTYTWCLYIRCNTVKWRCSFREFYNTCSCFSDAMGGRVAPEREREK
jgi:hypothetical protein